jgi:hypothetical protein
MRKSLLLLVITLLGCVVLAGCSIKAKVAKPELSGDNQYEANQASDQNEEDATAPDMADSTEPEEDEENVWDGGPDFSSLADEFYGLSYTMQTEDILEKYAINFVDGGKYADFKGDIGDVISEYKNKDLDGDHKPDVIKREGKHYVFECTKKGIFTTDDYSALPNEGEVIEFQDLGNRNVCEILITHYTYGTAGITAWDTTLYTSMSGEWTPYTIIDKEGIINSKELQEAIAEKTGHPYEANSVRIAGVELEGGVCLLLDFGSKNGALQTTEYTGAYLDVCDDDLKSYGLSNYTLKTVWPLETTGEPVEMSKELQHDLNIFLSNFSEQGYNCAGYNPAELAHFTLDWKILNNPSGLKYENGRTWIDQSSVNQILGRYFGSNLEEGDFFGAGENNPYNGTIEISEDNKAWYTEPSVDGETYLGNAFSVVTDLQRIPGDNYDFLRAEFTIYAVNDLEYEDYGVSNTYYSLTAAKAEKLVGEGRIIPKETGVAIIDDVVSKHYDDGYWLDYYYLFE